jgi:CheY-like chemotaxis protein
MPPILIVDDNAIQAMTRRLILERAHLPVVLSDSGPAALTRIDAGEHFSMVITDHCMPEMSGPALVRKLRSFSQMPILVLSGLPEAESEYEGMDVFFRMKPIQPEDLISISRTLLFPALDQTA